MHCTFRNADSEQKTQAKRGQDRKGTVAVFSSLQLLKERDPGLGRPFGDLHAQSKKPNKRGWKSGVVVSGRSRTQCHRAGCGDGWLSSCVCTHACESVVFRLPDSVVLLTNSIFIRQAALNLVMQSQRERDRQTDRQRQRQRDPRRDENQRLDGLASTSEEWKAGIQLQVHSCILEGLASQLKCFAASPAVVGLCAVANRTLVPSQCAVASLQSTNTSTARNEHSNDAQPPSTKALNNQFQIMSTDTRQAHTETHRDTCTAPPIPPPPEKLSVCETYEARWCLCCRRH